MQGRRTLPLLLLVIVLLSACEPASLSEPLPTPLAGAEAPTVNALPATTEEVIVTFGAPESEREVYEPLISKFNADNPGVRVQFVAVEAAGQLGSAKPDSVNRTMRALASAADTAVLEQPLPQHTTNDALLDLTPLLDADPAFDRADYYPAALPAGDGAVRVLPLRIQVPLLNYNKDMWNARNLPAPKSDWTWPDLLAAADQLADQRNGETQVYGLLNRDDLPGAVAALLGELQAAGVDLLEPGSAPRLDQEAVVAALERTVMRVKSGALAAPPTPDHFEDLTPLIRAGKAGLWPVEQWLDDPAALPFPVGVVLFPLGRRPTSTIFDGLAISRGSQHPDAAWRWLAFLSRQTIRSSAVLAPINVVPARTSVNEGDPSWRGHDAETQTALAVMLARPAPAPAAAGEQPLIDALTAALQRVIQQRQSAAQSLKAAQALREGAISSAPAPTLAPIVVATPPPTPVAGMTQITFESSFTNRDDLFPRLVQRFNQEHTDIRVTFHYTSDPKQGNRLQDLAGRSDCFASFGPMPGDALSAVTDLQLLLDADAGFPRDDFLPKVFDPLQHEGRTIGLPLAAGFILIGYKKALFDTYGLEYPRASWTIDDFMRAAARLTQGDGSNRTYGFLYPAGDGITISFFLDQYGAAPTSGHGDTLRPNFTDPKVVQAMQAFLTLLHTASPFQHLSIKWREQQYTQIAQLIAGGQAGMWMNAGELGGFPGQRPTNTVAITVPPQGRYAPSLWGDQVIGLYISAKTSHPEACWTLLKAMSEDINLVSRLGMPVRLSAGESAAYAATSSSAVDIFRAYREALGRPPTPYNAGASLLELPYGYWFYSALDNALQGKDLEQELAIAQDRTTQFMACVRQGTKDAACARQVAPDDPGWLADTR